MSNDDLFDLFAPIAIYFWSNTGYEKQAIESVKKLKGLRDPDVSTFLTRYNLDASNYRRLLCFGEYSPLCEAVGHNVRNAYNDILQRVVNERLDHFATIEYGAYGEFLLVLPQGEHEFAGPLPQILELHAGVSSINDRLRELGYD